MQLGNHVIYYSHLQTRLAKALRILACIVCAFKFKPHGGFTRVYLACCDFEVVSAKGCVFTKSFSLRASRNHFVPTCCAQLWPSQPFLCRWIWQGPAHSGYTCLTGFLVLLRTADMTREMRGQ